MNLYVVYLLSKKKRPGEISVGIKQSFREYPNSLLRKNPAKTFYFHWCSTFRTNKNKWHCIRKAIFFAFSTTWILWHDWPKKHRHFRVEQVQFYKAEGNGSLHRSILWNEPQKAPQKFIKKIFFKNAV